MLTKVKIFLFVNVCAGVDHSKLLAVAEASLSFLPKGEPAAKEAAKYHGGELIKISLFK